MSRRLSVAGAALVALAAVARAEPRRWETVPMPPEMPAATTTGFVDAGDAAIYYATYGTGRGDPVILLHGGLGNSDHWAFQVPALAKRHPVIVVDSRNQGRSSFSRSKLTYTAMAGDVIAVMDALAIRRAAVVGWSDGGEIGLALAIHHPERVARLFVFGANYDARGSKPRKDDRTFQLYAARCKADFQKLSRTPKVYGAVVESLMPVWRAPVSFTKDQLRSIRAPVVVAAGEHDEIIRLEQLEEMAVLIPSAKLVVFDDTSHFALWQDPETFTRAVLDFLGA